MSDTEIEGCGKSTGQGWPRFDFVCDRTWADLSPTGADDVRHCAACDRRVHFCDNLVDAREHAAEGHGIAVDLGVIRREGDLRPARAVMGRPRLEDIRRTYEDDIDAVSQARLRGRKRRSARQRKEGT